MLGRALDPEPAGVVDPPIRRRDDAPARQIRARDRLLGACDLGGRAARDDPTAVLAGARAHVDQEVGGADRLLVVLDDDDRVSEVAQAHERGQEASVVALVQADRRLVEDVEHAHQRRADLCGEPDALRLAARERRGGAVQGEVADADVLEEHEPLADLAQDAGADRPLGVGEHEAVDELDRRRDRHARELGDVDAADRHGEARGLQAVAVARGARLERHVLLDPLLLVARVRVAVAAVEAREDALERQRVAALAAHRVAVAHVELLAAGAVQEELALDLAEGPATASRGRSRTCRRSPGSPARRSSS